MSGEKVQFYKKRDEGTFPSKANPAAVGYDLYAAEDVKLESTRKTYKIKTAIACLFPNNLYGKIEARSGMCIDPGLITAGGVIDGDYQGEIFVLLKKVKRGVFWIRKGMRIAQLVFHRKENPDVEHKIGPIPSYLRNPAGRGECGLGSTGS